MSTVPPALVYEGPAVLKANQLFTARFRVTPNRDLHPGDRVVLAARHVSDLGVAQTGNPAAENYLALEGPGRWELGPGNDWRRHPWNRGIDLALREGTLRAGDTLTVILGDRSRGSPGFRCQSFAESAFRFRLGLALGEKPDWVVLPPEACPPIRLTGNRAARLSVVVSRATRNDGALDIHVKPEDAYGNVADGASGDVTLLLDDASPLAKASLRSGEAAEARCTLPGAPSWRRITAAADDGSFWARSNPFGPSPVSGYHLFFGEIHGQTGLCDGTNPPDDIYAYARRAAGLDFAAITSHDFELTAGDWRELQEAARKAHDPGRFVTFLGVEWSGRPAAGGDNNIYFLDDEAPLPRSAPLRIPAAWDPAEGEFTGSRDLTQTIAALKGRRFMVVPHCGGRRCNFDFHDPAVMPLFEMHSCHRTYEHVAREAIGRGLRFGFIGGSDDHRGALGDSHCAARETFFSSHSGLVAAYARELTRESLWEAFFARRVYATNGPRIALAVGIDGRPMGSEIEARPGATLTLSFWACLDGLLDRVDVLRDGAVVQTRVGEDNQVAEIRGEVAIEADDRPRAHSIKVCQTDGGWACSSPIWVVPVSEKRGDLA